MPNKVVVGVDGSEHSRFALAWGAAAARALGVRLQVVTAWEYPSGMVLPFAPPSVTPSEMEAQATQDLAAFVEPTLGADSDAELTVTTGSPAGALLESVSSDSLLVVGTRGRGGFRSLVLGSVSRACVEHAPCPIVVVRGEGPLPGDGPVVVGVDLGDDAAVALDWATGLHGALGVGVIAVLAWTPPPAELRSGRVDDLRTEAVAALDEWVDARWPGVEHVALDGEARKVLREYVEDVEPSLLVVGRRGVSGLEPMHLGSVASYLVARSPTAVAVIPSGS